MTRMPLTTAGPTDMAELPSALRHHGLLLPLGVCVRQSARQVSTAASQCAHQGALVPCIWPWVWFACTDLALLQARPIRGGQSHMQQQRKLAPFITNIFWACIRPEACQHCCCLLLQKPSNHAVGTTCGGPQLELLKLGPLHAKCAAIPWLLLLGAPGLPHGTRACHLEGAALLAHGLKVFATRRCGAKV